MPTLFLFDKNKEIPDFTVDSFLKNDAYVGHITYYFDKNGEKKSVIVGSLEVKEDKRGQKYGQILLNLMLLDLHGMEETIGIIHLDDCSDCQMTRDSIYFIQGFRIHDEDDLAKMSIIIGEDELPTPSHNYTNTPKRQLPLAQPKFKGIPDIILQNVSQIVREKIASAEFKSHKIIKVDDDKNQDTPFDVNKAQRILQSILKCKMECRIKRQKVM